jgi:hypothetical protein
MKKYMILFLLINNLSAWAQTPQITDEQVEIHLIVTDKKSKPLQTTIRFIQQSPGKTVVAKTDVRGRAVFKLNTSSHYTVKIAESDDEYSYEIPEFAATPASLTMSFTIREPEN